ncbi:MAG: hypothetical protein JWM76_2293 [Pseudonocardiales bacterium]|nr:hypothetical protein [Pseudonocardiales bacterium]
MTPEEPDNQAGPQDDGDHDALHADFDQRHRELPNESTKPVYPQPLNPLSKPVDPKLFDNLMPKIDPKLFDNLMPKIDPKLFDNLMPKIDPKLFDNLVPKIDPKLFDNLVPKIDPKLFDNLMPMIDPQVFANLVPRVEPLIDPELFDRLMPNIISAVDPGILRHLAVKAVPMIAVGALDRLVTDTSWLGAADERARLEDSIRQDFEEEVAGATSEDEAGLSAVATWFLTLGRRCLHIAAEMTQAATRTNSVIEEWQKLAVTCFALYWFLHHFLG